MRVCVTEYIEPAGIPGIPKSEVNPNQIRSRYELVQSSFPGIAIARLQYDGPGPFIDREDFEDEITGESARKGSDIGKKGEKRRRRKFIYSPLSHPLADFKSVLINYPR